MIKVAIPTAIVLAVSTLLLVRRKAKLREVKVR